MIRSISLALLLTGTTLAIAEPLYKWLEPDGSITFSPTPPVAGTPFEMVEGPAKKSPETVSTTSRARPLPPPGTTQTEVAGANSDIQTGGANPRAPLLKYAPSTIAGQNNLPDAISRSSEKAQEASQVAQPAEAVPTPQLGAAGPVQLSAAANAANTKQNRCQDLRKRVLSLERRLKSRLTPDDMDNTVVHMARYQRSFNQHCVQ